MKTNLFARGAAALALAVLAACSETGQPLAPENPGLQPLVEMNCIATLSSRSVTCSEVAAGGPSKVIAGNQGVYVRLISSNITMTADTFAFDVNVQNLIPQALGTTDGITLDSAAVRVFFHIPPFVRQGTGSVSVANADGQAEYTGLGQDYYQYDEILEPNETSTITRRWQLVFTPGVDQIGLKLYVAAKVPRPDGYVELSAGNPFQLTGTTQSFTGVVRDVVGNVVDTPISWMTSDSAVATVDASGTLTAVAPGRVILTATAGIRIGADTIDVCPDLPVGGVYTASMPSASRVCFGGQASTAEYTYMPVNLSTASSLALSVTGTGIQAVTGPPSPNIIPTGGITLGGGNAALAANDDGHVARLAAEKRDLAGRTALVRNRAASGARRTITPGVPAVGDLWNLNAVQGCSGTPDVRVGRVRSVSQRAIIVGDTANPAGGFTTAQYDSIALEFDSIAYSVDVANFGAPTDMDNNSRVVLFFTRAVNELSPPASSQVTNGYFTNRDLFGTGDCALSNQGEILYMLVPDPTGAVNSNVRTVSFVRGNVTRTAGHELQHLINASRRLTAGAPFEEAWLDEGMSQAAEELMFYRTAVGLAPRQNINLSNLTTGPNASRRVAAFNTYANGNFGNLRSWLQRPDTSGAFKTTSPASPAFRGVNWAFLRYASDRVNGSDAAFWQSLVNTTLTGKANIQNAIGADPDLWLRDFVGAMYADDAVTGIAAQYTQPSWNFRSIYGGLGGVPLLARPLTNATALTLSYSRGGGTAYMRFGVPSAGFATLTALSAGLPPTSPFQLIVVRTK
ncbi:Ig-like domain-containing protein [Longimicrobium terrae]|uniref:BIG2 domain-containing protein n=1 Tax=Longimicrobium terrae TaxID=1639882 RepID=A0A841H7G7_9BACT|nr:Ig-like domain-containing protein [Longimicrobium terrae]MBB4639470.1 hypothetical protein [Longimicrobium terrae]MBB6073842.1 hypothetical protein [Longimicrobium terrae]NNC32519.1 hypothetical protein [Longimicrobium terrae]